MNTPQTPSDAVREAPSFLQEAIARLSEGMAAPNGGTVTITKADAFAIGQHIAALAARVAEQTAQLAQCFKIAGADSDGNEDFRIAPHAVQAVTDLRRDYDEACNEAETLRHAALAGAEPDDAAELSAWRELGRCAFLGSPTFPNEWPQDVSVIGYSLSMRHKAHALAGAAPVESLSESDKDVALAQAVEFAEYVERQAKGAMAEAAKRFLSLPYSQEIAERLHAPAKAREVTDEMVQRGIDAFNDTYEAEFFSTGRISDNKAQAIRAVLDAALATFAEGDAE